MQSKNRNERARRAAGGRPYAGSLSNAFRSHLGELIGQPRAKSGADSESWETFAARVPPVALDHHFGQMISAPPPAGVGEPPLSRRMTQRRHSLRGTSPIRRRDNTDSQSALAATKSEAVIRAYLPRGDIGRRRCGTMPNPGASCRRSVTTGWSAWSGALAEGRFVRETSRPGIVFRPPVYWDFEGDCPRKARAIVGDPWANYALS